jgi:hypothetical protein
MKFYYLVKDLLKEQLLLLMSKLEVSVISKRLS